MCISSLFSTAATRTQFPQAPRKDDAHTFKNKGRVSAQVQLAKAVQVSTLQRRVFRWEAPNGRNQSKSFPRNKNNERNLPEENSILNNF